MDLSNKVILGFINGQESSIEKVYVEYKNLMYFVIAGYVNNKDECDDVLSEAFLKAIEHAKELKDPIKLKSYLCSIAKNEAINHLKRNNTSLPCDSLDELYGEEDRTNSLLNSIENILTNKETIVVYYRAVFSYTWEEIAEETGISESTAKRIYNKAKEKLRKELL